MKPIFIFLVSILVIFGCKSLKDTPSTIKTIHFGTGGGITGATEDNYITSEGAVYKNETYVQTIKGEDLKMVISRAEKLKSDTINNPGNIYNYIHFEDKGITYRYTWSNKTTIAPGLKDWYDQLMSFTKLSE